MNLLGTHGSRRTLQAAWLFLLCFTGLRAIDFDLLALSTPPILQAQRNADGSISLHWSASLTNFVLESAPSLEPPVFWTPFSDRAVLSGNEMALPIADQLRSEFYRLRRIDSMAPAVSVATGSIHAAAGGQIQLPGGKLLLAIPPGALSQDTTITITNYQYPAVPEMGISAQLVFDPPGLRFATPAILRIQLDVPVTDLDSIRVESLSPLNPPRNFGSEISYFEPITDFKLTNNMIEVPITHFSFLQYRFEENLYGIFDFDGKYMKKGDLIYALTNADNEKGGFWTPGHTGLYLGSTNSASTTNDGVTIIESTSRDDALKQFVDGVQFATLPNFKFLKGQHIFMGARRPLLFEPTDEERVRISAWATNLIGTPYASLGTDSNGISCVGLTEGAYEAGTGKQVVPAGVARFLLSPLRQFLFTTPLNQVEIRPGETFEMLARPIAKVPGLPGDYYNSPDYCDLSVEPYNDAALEAMGRVKFDRKFGGFNLTSTEADSGKNLGFFFTFDARKVGLKSLKRAFFINVQPAQQLFRRQDPPLIRRGFSSGNLNPTNLVISASGLEASTEGKDETKSRFKLSWDPPPATLAANATFSMDIRADAGTNNPAQTTFAFGGPYIAGEINGSANSTTSAFAGYERIQGTDYKLVVRSLQQQVTLEGTVPVVEVDLVVFRTAGAFTSGEVGATVTWAYTPVP